MTSNKSFSLLWVTLAILIPTLCFSQNTHDYISNPSFEDTPRKGTSYSNVAMAMKNDIKGWYDCGILDFKNCSAPDIHSKSTTYFSVHKTPSDGNTYLGLVVRQDTTWEGVSTHLIRELKKDSCYTLSIDLCKSISYFSKIKGLEDKVYRFKEPVVLSLWGGEDFCAELQLLYESPPVDNQIWQTYEIYIQPKMNISHITLQAYYVDDVNTYNGNLLIDNISSFVITECEE